MLVAIDSGVDLPRYDAIASKQVLELSCSRTSSAITRTLSRWQDASIEVAYNIRCDHELYGTWLTSGIDWTQDEAEPQGDNAHLWEESWDDDDTSEEFSAQLKYVLPILFDSFLCLIDKQELMLTMLV